ncbi:hypothetical protein TanjilG_17473 [Lupinus angustifolius]|uniref:Purple acid phosphatase n=1 Tax=Lupinus angustifolius TaxID=3871 RepID=A0A4P1R1J9_LUPAN|nr:hypothetical protein TanjilG_17473 [Lupinus angustifolius]
MESCNWVLKYASILLVLFYRSSSSTYATPISSFSPSPLELVIMNTTSLHQSYTALSDFRLINRRFLETCSAPSSSVQINISSSKSTLSNDEFVTVTVTGVKNPSEGDWVAMISPSNSNVGACPLNEAYYIQTGDIAKLPLLCHYPIKAQLLQNDPEYLSCKKKGCSGSLKFHVVNIRSDIEFAFFSGGYLNPCLVTRSNPIKFDNPKMPLYGHLSSIDSTATSMRLTWVSGDNQPQQVQYGDGKKVTSEVTTFSQNDMCSNPTIPSPAKDFGWHDPGYIHSAPGALSVIKAITDEVKSNNVNSIFHIGDISYATGFLAEWDYFLQLINPIASKVPYMTAIGNHERDYIASGSVYVTPDSGGECGVPYETYFPMPVQEKDKPWYSIEQASVHFTIISTEHNLLPNSEQYQWIQKDLASVNREKTPWLVFMGHRQMYHSGKILNEDKIFVSIIEPLLLQYKVKTWSLKRISEFGYLRGHATRTELKLELVNSGTRKVEDTFRITK